MQGTAQGPPKPMPPMVSKPKVYCENCVHFQANAKIEEACVGTCTPIMTDDTWFRKGVCTGYVGQADPRERNKFNDCKYFKGKEQFRIVRTEPIEQRGLLSRGSSFSN